MEVLIKCPVNPTENPEKVRKAVMNIFPEAEINIGEGSLTGRATSLDRFREILRDLRIRDSARAFLMANIEENQVSFSISKQAAYMGKISFGGLNPALGEIEILIKDDDPKTLIRWLTEVGD